MLLFFALLVALLVLLLPPLVAGLATALIVHGTHARGAIAQWEHVLETLGAAPVLAAVVTASVVLLVETLGIVWWGGRVLDRMEPLDTK
jgi:hypothetical protein